MAAQTIVITGGGGFVGRYLVDELQDFRVIVWDKEVDGVAVDITNEETYLSSLEKEQPDWIVHLAAISSVSVAMKNPELTHKVNVEAVDVLCNNVVRLSPKTKLLIASSADIYGGDVSSPLSELSLSEVNPKNAYAQSKFEMEKIIEEKYLDRCIRVRPFPHIGPGQQKGFVTADFASQVADIEKGNQEPIIRVGNLDAERDFTDVRDVVRAYRLLLEDGKIGEVYNIASGEAVSIQHILDTFVALSDVAISVEIDEDKVRPNENPGFVGDAGKLMAQTGWESTIPLDQSLRDILDYWRKRV